MANLSNKEVSNRPEKPQSAETFIKKILKEDGLGPDFKTDDGLFCSDYVTVTYNDNSTKKYERQSLKKVNEEMIAEYIARGPFTKSIDITGKFFGSNKQQTLKVSKFVKTGEFGGQEGGGWKVMSLLRGLARGSTVTVRMEMMDMLYPFLTSKICLSPVL